MRSSAAHWHTVLAGGLNKGGQGIYALDVTESCAHSRPPRRRPTRRPRSSWEFTDADDADLGYTFSQPVDREVARHDRGGTGRWVVVFGNGYNSTLSRRVAQHDGQRRAVHRRHRRPAR